MNTDQKRIHIFKIFYYFNFNFDYRIYTGISGVKKDPHNSLI